MREKSGKYAALYLAFFIYSLASVFSKVASQQSSLWKVFLFIGIEILFLAIYALLWQQVLKRFQLGVAIANKGITVILSLMWSVVIFKEQISVQNILGAAIIILGIWVVSSSE